MNPARCQLRYPASDPFADVNKDEFRMDADYAGSFCKSQSSYENNFVLVMLLIHFRNSNPAELFLDPVVL